MSASTMFLLALTPGPMEIIILGMVVLLLFGNRLPSVMRSLGVGITEFKKGIKGEGVDDEVNDRRLDERRAETPRRVVHEEQHEEVRH